jgi:predicted MFS family arabinose efflux permease
MRTFAGGEFALAASAFLGGAAASLLAVAIPPTVSRLSSEASRARAFSIFFGCGIGMGVLGGLAGGRIPDWLTRAGLPRGAPAKQASLLAACGFMALAAWWVGRLPRGRDATRKRVAFPRGGFIWRFLLVLAIWNLATGSFNPFFNAYFSRHLHASVEWIGTVFAGSQFLQMGAVLLAPAVLRRLGLVRGVAGMQLAAASAMLALAVAPSGAAAALAYACYMSLQYMSEPGAFSMLMSRVGQEEQGGASSLSFLVTFSAQAAAAAIAGAALTRFGYPGVLGAAACVAAIAALAFRFLLRPFDRPPDA